MRSWFRKTLVLGLLVSAACAADEDPYLTYIKNAPEFKPVRQDPGAWTNRWNTWIYMPWRFQWTIGTGDKGGQFCKDYGFNGGFTDHADTGVLPWLEKWNLLFYCDHLCGKGSVKVRVKKNFENDMRDPRSIRAGSDGLQPLDAAMVEKLKKMMDKRVGGLRKSPVRAAYALDDEISWGSFLKPISWRVNDDDKAYETWLAGYYGGKAPAAQYVCPTFLMGMHSKALKDLDFSPFLDRMTYNDSVWANFLGTLVEYSNTLDPETPCGFVGGQSPNLFGGYDYSKLCKKIQFIEAYLGTAQSIIRSFNPLIPQVTTHFHGNPKLDAGNDTWQVWWCFAHGNRGMIGWVEKWFDDAKKPAPWLEEFKATNFEVGGKQGPKLVGAKWIHDGVAIYYSHPSIQAGWCLDMEPHGKSWVNRNNDSAHGTWHLGRAAWEKILADSGIQYNWIAYDDVVLNGVPAEYKVLILPSTFALSDIEAKRIREFCEKGGTVIADFACGIFDQHGKGRAKGVLDDLFGVTHDGSETKKDFFAGKLWVETNQDEAFGGGIKKLIATQSPKLEDGFAVAETKLPTRTVKKVGAGTAVYLNLSPLRYLAYRSDGAATDAHRKTFTANILAAGVKPWVKITSNGKRPATIESTYFAKNGRTYVFVLQNASVSSSELGDTTATGVEREKIAVDVEFPAAVKDLVDERSGKNLGDGTKFKFEFKGPEAAFLSFAGAPPR